MTLFLLIVVGALAAVVVWGISTHNTLVSLKHGVARAWSNIDVLLVQRHAELPKLVEACRQHQAFERDTLERVVAARARVQTAREQGDPGALGVAETALRGGLGQLFAVVEAYPDLKADASFAALIERITTLEDGIADRRETYNEAVNLFNVRIEQFPDSIVAGMFDFPPRRLLQFSDGAKTDPDLKPLFAA
ncbi:MAG: LemA family protein [Burkholderiales bacterium]|nr:LemA family protein [Burkholderiales bacterium]